jgi:hypothetical protein
MEGSQPDPARAVERVSHEAVGKPRLDDRRIDPPVEEADGATPSCHAAMW